MTYKQNLEELAKEAAYNESTKTCAHLDYKDTLDGYVCADCGEEV